MPNKRKFPVLEERKGSRKAIVKIRSRWLSKIAAYLLVTGFRLLFATCRKVHIAPDARWALDHPDAAKLPESFILTAWHDALVIPTFCSNYPTRHRTCCLVSQHQDGGYLADSMALLGYRTVRGSSSRGGAAAMKQLIADTEGLHIVITPDGPRGPRREMKAGPVFLASQTGRRILPGAYVCRRGWRIQGSWTDMLIPKPFTTIYLVTGEPLSIPSGLSREELQEQVQRAQRAMDEIHAHADALLLGSPAAKLPEDSELTRETRKAA